MGSWRAGCVATRTSGSAARAGETDRPKRRHRAPARPIPCNICLGEQGRLCCLVVVGVRADGTKELVAVADGERQSTDSWSEVLRDLRRRGMQAPVVAVGDGALGLWAALRDVFAATRHQRDWVHKAANVLAGLPAAVQAGAGAALAEIRDAPDRDHAKQAIQTFARDDGVKWPKAVAKVTDDAEELLAFFDFPAEHWGHLKTSNPIVGVVIAPGREVPSR
jgi:putative transposase